MPDFHVEIQCNALVTADTIANAKAVAAEIAIDLAASNPHQLIYETKPGLVWPAHPRQSREESHPGAFSYLEMEAALCVWECINDWTLHNQPANKRADWEELRKSVGSAELRHQSIALGQWVLSVYNLCVDHDQDMFDAMSYDWEVVPMILDLARDSDGAPVIYEDAFPPAKSAAEIIIEKVRRWRWMADARYEATKQWGYDELLTDHPERVDEAMKAKQDPAEFVKLLGEKYDLIPRSDW